MKLSKVFASVAAATVAVSTLAVSAFAADSLLSMTVEKNSGPKDAGQVNLWELTFNDEVDAWAGNVDKVVATMTSQAYANGALGGNTVAADGWAASAQLENSEAGTNEWVWDNIGGLKAGKDEEGNEIGYFKVEVWWMNAQGEEGNQTPATLTIDKVDFYDKDGALLATYPVADDDKTDDVQPGDSTDVKPGDSSDVVDPGKTEDPAEPGDCSGEPVNPPTGVAVAVIPAAVAAAAVATTGIVLKKRSK